MVGSGIRFRKNRDAEDFVSNTAGVNLEKSMNGNPLISEFCSKGFSDWASTSDADAMSLYGWDTGDVVSFGSEKMRLIVAIVRSGEAVWTIQPMNEDFRDSADFHTGIQHAQPEVVVLTPTGIKIAANCVIGFVAEHDGGLDNGTLDETFAGDLLRRGQAIHPVSVTLHAVPQWVFELNEAFHS